MTKLLIPVSDSEFKNMVSIRFKHILDGFNLFKNFTINGKNLDDGENKLIRFIERVFQENNSQVYIDFYINKISENDKQNLMKLIPKEDKEILKNHLNMQPSDEVFYTLSDKSLIPFFVRLNTREAFFVTFYFTNKPITIWGNYNMNFPCFTDSDSDFNFYYNLAKSFGLCT